MASEWEDAPEKKSKSADWEDAPVKTTQELESPELGAVLGGVVGAGVKAATVLGKTAAAAKNIYDKVGSTAKEIPQSVPKTSAPVTGSPDLRGSEKWIQSLTGQTLPGGQMDKEALQKAQEMARTIGRGGELAGGTNVGGILLPPEGIKKTAAAERAAAQAAAKAQEMGKIRAALESAKGFAAPALEKAAPVLQKAKQLGEFLNTGATGKVIGVANPMLALAGAGAQYADMQNRFNQGDTARGVISGLGALGSGISALPHPIARGAGAAVGLGAPMLNYLIDKAYGREGYADGGNVKKSPTSIAGLFKSVGAVRGPSLSSVTAEHFASLPQKIEDNLRHQQDVMNRAMPMDMVNGRLELGKADPEAMKEFVGSMIPIGGMTKVVTGPISRIVGEFDKRFDPRKLEQEKLQKLATEVTQYQKPAPKVSLTDFEGYPFLTSMSDRTAAGGHLTGINSAKLNSPVHLQGGQDYMFNNPGQVWASAPGPVNQLMKQAQGLKDFTGKDPIYLPWRMAPTGGDFAHMTGETMLAHADTVLGKADKLDLNKAIKNFIPDWKGLGSPESMEQFLGAKSGVRKKIQNMIDKDFRGRGALGIGEARLAVADPTQLNAPIGGIQNVGRIFTDKPIVQKSGHGSYPRGVPGEGVGVIDTPRNIFELMPNAVKQRGIMDPTKPSQQDIRALQMKPYSGIIDDKLLKSLGYAEGGLAALKKK